MITYIGPNSAQINPLAVFKKHLYQTSDYAK